jgi:hypothetical protein
MGNRFQIATGTVPKEEPKQNPKPEQDISKKERDMAEHLKTFRNFLDTHPEMEVARENIMRAMGIPEEILTADNNTNDPLDGSYLRHHSYGGPVPNPQLRISGPNGNQVIIPLRNIVARAQPIDGYASVSHEYELVIRMPRDQAEYIMSDIRRAQRERGIPVTGM